MTLLLGGTVLQLIQEHGERSYPEEGAGFLLGTDSVDLRPRRVVGIVPLQNAREEGARGNRYLITPQDYLRAELRAEEQGVEVIGVFHSHPDHPDMPSEFDREWAQPQFSYLITRIDAGRARSSRAWRLTEDRAAFAAEEIQIEGIPQHN
jgi:proteasome lid subunit RPN8/RPN11